MHISKLLIYSTNKIFLVVVVVVVVVVACLQKHFKRGLRRLSNIKRVQHTARLRGLMVRLYIINKSSEIFCIRRSMRCKAYKATCCTG